MLRVAGDLDLASASALASALREPQSVEAERIVLDLAEVEFIDSTGIGVLVQARREAERENRELLLANLSRGVDRILELTGIRSQFAVA